MLRKYPIKLASSAPATGRLLYEYLMRNISIPATANHNIWYEGEKAKLGKPEEFAFRGDIPLGETLELVTLAGKPLRENEAGSLQDNVKPISPSTFLYTFTGNEAYVLVADLSEKARQELGIPKSARDRDKVYNSNFKPFDQLSQFTRWSNELAALSVPKSISSYLAGNKGKVNYSERDVLDFLSASFDDLSGPEMTHILHGNHLAWAALAYMRDNGNVEGDILTEFHGQNPLDFYSKDLGTVLPAMFFALANLGQDPMQFYNKLDVEIWGAKDAAKYMKRYLPELRVGVVGYCLPTNFDEDMALKHLVDAYNKISADLPNRSITIVSGLTNVGVLKLAYEEAKRRGWKTAGVACKKVYDFQDNWFPVDEEPVIVGENWGDDSKIFTGGTGIPGHPHEHGLDVLVRIGLGNQSLDEAGRVKEAGKPTYEYNLPKIE